MLHSGHCHCGRLTASFETQKTPRELGVRACQCEFCRRHGAVNVSDPAGKVVINAAEADIARYRFALRTADFLICKHCGVYIAAVIGEGDQIFSTLNVAGLRMNEFLEIEEQPMRYGAEDENARVDRRRLKWTPTRFIDAALSASFFGPHQ
ncbi:MAG: hypothetical protein KDD85_05685 [Parvularculaceae bacterium]|nr:hypothetical protein [Parvularculaceae bacterium]